MKYLLTFSFFISFTIADTAYSVNQLSEFRKIIFISKTITYGIMFIKQIQD